MNFPAFSLVPSIGPLALLNSLSAETADGNIIRFLNYSHEHIEIESAAKLIKRKLASQTWRETQLSYLVFPRRLVSNGRSMKSG